MLNERIRKGTEENLRNKQVACRKTRMAMLLTSGCVTGLTAAVFGHPFNHRIIGW